VKTWDKILLTQLKVKKLTRSLQDVDTEESIKEIVNQIQRDALRQINDANNNSTTQGQRAK